MAVETTSGTLTPPRRTKDESIETLRGLAIILVVAGHVIGIDALGGMKVADDSLWRYLYDSLQYIRMPLFTAISGWVYALYPVRAHQGVQFMSKKARRLLLPMVFVGTLYFLVQYVVPGTNVRGDLSQIWRIYVFPYTVYWYLPALFLIFGLMAWIDIRRWADSIPSWAFWLLLTSGGAVAGHLLAAELPNVFAVWSALCLLPFFILGVGIKRFSEQLASPRMRKVYLAGFLIGLLLQQWVWFDSHDSESLRTWSLHIPIGIISSAFLLVLPLRNRFLIWLGSYAYTIYLFHAFGTSAGRILLVRIGMDSTLAIFVLSLILGLGFPILVDEIFSRSRLTSLLFLGRLPKIS